MIFTGEFPHFAALFLKTSLNFPPLLVSAIQIPYNILVLLSLKTGNGLRTVVIGKGCWLKKDPDIRKRRIELDDKEKEGLENSLDKKEEVEEETVENDDSYEKICYMCRRPESKAGPMITMPGNLCICSDCMQKAFDSLKNNGFDFSEMPSMPYMNFGFNDFMPLPPENMEVPQAAEDQEKVVKAAGTYHEGYPGASSDQGTA